ncbi:anion permease [Ruminococcaceae bacterium OttesenSCG-928-I18]|nr:anion permease [Ruminococcaceae bacterium OttesenSCG-928-I18]
MDKAKACFLKIGSFFFKDMLFTAALLAAVFTSFLQRPDPAAIDWKVLACLFGLMVAVKGLEYCNVLEAVSSLLVRHCKSERGVVLAMSLLAFFSSMFLTNDVAILTLLPILFVLERVCKMGVLLPAILVTVCANLGSVVTPFGNPQNLFLFSFYGLDSAAFFSLSLPFGAVCLVVMTVFVFLFKKPLPMQVLAQRESLLEGKSIVAFGLAAVVVIFCVFGVLPFWVAVPVPLGAALLCNRRVLREVDYRLLLTFLFLFIAIDNLASISFVQEGIERFTQTPQDTYLAAALLSQVMSNVLCAVLLAPFTEQVQALFWGVNVGGLGTLVASMANLIAFKLFIKRYPGRGARFVVRFSAVNFGLFLLLGGIFYLLLPMG